MASTDRASVAHMVARLVARRGTRAEEIPALVRTVQQAIANLEGEPPTIVEEDNEAAEIVALPRPERVRRPRKPAEPPAPEAVESEEPAAPPPPPRLVRRAELVTASPAREEAALLRTPSSPVLRGVVKWFDQRTRRGALRLPGHGDDVPVEPQLLEEMAISRLYKGQEIEATLSEDAQPRVVRLMIPGGAWQVHSMAGMVKGRQAKPVVVELKREALRRVAARAEAETLLGPSRNGR